MSCSASSLKPCCCLGGATRTPHPDHRASHVLAQAALVRLPAPPRQLEYLVWAWERAAPFDKPEPTDNVREVRIDITAQRPAKLRAIAAHRTQIASGVFTDDPGGFLLLPAILARFAERPFELYYAPV